MSRKAPSAPQPALPSNGTARASCTLAPSVQGYVCRLPVWLSWQPTFETPASQSLSNAWLRDGCRRAIITLLNRDGAQPGVCRPETRRERRSVRGRAGPRKELSMRSAPLHRRMANRQTLRDWPVANESHKRERSTQILAVRSETDVEP